MSEEMQGEGRVETPRSATLEWDRLREVREAQGLSLDQVSAYLKLTERQLEAIERGNLSALPGIAFAKGFVRNYARFLKLDPEPFIALIKDDEHDSVLPTEMYSSDLGRMPTDGGSGFSAWPALLIVVVVAIIIGAGWYFHWFESNADSSALSAAEQSEAVEMHEPLTVPAAKTPVEHKVPESVVPAAASVPVATASSVLDDESGRPNSSQSLPASAAIHSAAASAATTPSADKLDAGADTDLQRIVFGFDGDSWVEVRDASGKSVFSRMNQAGSTQEVQGKAPFSLVIGNASEVHLTWKGQPVDLTSYLKKGSNVARLTVK